VKDPLAELVARCQKGDKAAFGELVEETQDRVYSLAYNVLSNRQEAEDMTQEVYLRVWRALPSFRGEAKFTTWLHRIAVNACLNRRRQLRSRLRIVDDAEALERVTASLGDPVAATIHREGKESLWKTVTRLPEKYSLVVNLFYQQQLSYKEIADTLSLPLGTVKAHLNRARQALAKSLRPEQEIKDASM
jgi:RNA polymerase sigma-70 factor (ECF subfamily)